MPPPSQGFPGSLLDGCRGWEPRSREQVTSTVTFSHGSCQEEGRPSQSCFAGLGSHSLWGSRGFLGRFISDHNPDAF